MTLKEGPVHAFGKTENVSMSLNDNATFDYCLECIGEMAIQCAWCKNPIFIGNPITLYIPNEKDFKIPEHAVVYNEKPLQLVGCLGWDCAQTGADRAGFWLPGEDGKGYVKRVPTAYELILSEDTPSPVSAVIINDVGNIDEALNPELVLEKKDD